MKKYTFSLILKGRDTWGETAEVILKLPGKRTTVGFKLNRREAKKIFRAMPKRGESYKFEMEVKPTSVAFEKLQGKTPVVQIIHQRKGNRSAE